MTSYRVFSHPATDSKREEFRKYLEKTGVLDVLTRALVNLYEEQERPPDALEYLKCQLNGIASDTGELESTKEQLAEATAKLEELKLEVSSLKTQLSEYEGNKDTGSGAS